MVAVVATASFAVVACSAPPHDSKPASSSVEYFELSYDGASGRLAGLNEFDAADQIRDWVRFGLASHLELDTPRVRDALYDTFPVRDAGFADVARQPTGVGRSLPDGNGVLHILVPRDDPYRSRTIGLELDQYRTDTGSDPARVQVHDYEINREAQLVTVVAEKPAAAEEVRTANGYFTVRVDQPAGLTEFLERSLHVSLFEIRGQEIWASGWAWPEDAGARLNVEDVWVVQHSYEHPEKFGNLLPGFSLDPTMATSEEDLLAVLRDVDPDLVHRVWTDTWSGSGFRSAADLARQVNNKLFGLPAEAELPDDRSKLWALLNAIERQPVYHAARYDGALLGTAVGMTLFYTDYMAKNWLLNIGEGVPPDGVSGFVPDTARPTPLGHCTTGEGAESSRLWFGQRDEGFGFADDRLSLGSRATQLFAEGTSGGELEPSYAMSRGLRWWDQHYAAVADYDGQFRRLEQIMRWSGALEWLTLNGARLSPPDTTRITTDLRFDDWYVHNADLRERGDIAFVAPPSAAHEAVRYTPAVYPNCGATVIDGGVSLADTLHQRGGQAFHAALPDSVARAGAFDEQSTFDSATGVGHIIQGSVKDKNLVNRVERGLSRTPEGHAAVDVTGQKSRNASFGDLKDETGANTSRSARTEFYGAKGNLRQRLTLHGEPVGELVAIKPSRAQVVLWWARGTVDGVRSIVASIQNGQTGTPESQHVLLAVALPDGSTVYRVPGPGVRWLSVDRANAETSGPSFRFGWIDPGTGTVRFGSSRFVPPPTPSAPWMTVATGKTPLAQAAVAPSSQAIKVSVKMSDGSSAALYRDGDSLLVRSDDPHLGLNGTVAGAALLRMSDVVVRAMDDAAASADSFYRGVTLGPDGAVMIRDNHLVLFPNTDPVYALVSRATGTRSARGPPTFEFEGGGFRHVATLADSVKRIRSENDVSLGTVLEQNSGAGYEVYLHEDIHATVPTDRGFIFPERIPYEHKVNTVTVRTDLSVFAAVPPILHHLGARWYRAETGRRVTNGPTKTGTGTGNANGPGGGPGSGSGRGKEIVVVLVCPPTGDDMEAPEDEHDWCGP